MRHLWMSWKKMQVRRNFLKKSVLSTKAFMRQVDVNLVKSCFDALKINKEEEKVKLLTDQLNGIVDPQILQ